MLVENQQAFDKISVTTQGSITRKIVCGPMFAGKTTRLIKKASELLHYRHNFSVLSPAFDRRHVDKLIISHDGVEFSHKTVVGCDNDVLSALDEASDPQKSFHILVDEIQFFDIGYQGFFLDTLDFWVHNNRGARDISIDFFGLDMDSDMKLWPLVREIQDRYGDIHEKLTASCDICGRPAPFTRRRDGHAGTRETGDHDIYTVRCEEHLDTNKYPF